MLCVRSPSSKLLQIGQKLEKWQWRHNLLTWHHRQVLFVVVLFFLSRLVTGPSFMSMSSLVLELWQFSFIRVKLTFCPIKKLGFHFWLIWKSICCWFDKTFVEVVTDIYRYIKSGYIGGIVVPKSKQHDMLSNFISNSFDMFRIYRKCKIFQN